MTPLPSRLRATARGLSEVLARSATLAEAIPRALEAIGSGLDFSAGLAWQEDGDVLRYAALWRAPDTAVPEFEHDSRTRTFVRGEGLPGRVWKSGLPGIIPELASDPNFPRRLSAAHDHLLSAAAFPLPGYGVLEFYLRQAQPDPAEVDEVAQLLVSGLHEFVRRVREREKAQAAEARRAALMEAALDAIVSMDWRGMVVDWNAAAERMFGFSRTEAVGHEMAELIIPPRFREAHRHGLARVLAGGAPTVLNKRLELFAVRSDGSEFPVELTIARIPLEGPPAFTGSLRDLTERVRAQAAAQAQEALRDRFVGILGHDLRSPLSAILASAEHLARGSLEDGPKRAVARIVTSSRRMERMIAALLDLTRGRLGGGIPVTPQPHDLRAVAEQVLDEARAANPERTLALTAQGDTNASFDADRMAQVVSNLIANALEHGDPQGPISVLLDGDAAGLQLSVHNTGTPVPEAEREEIFDPFRKGSTSGRPGLGLGLYIAREIVRAHGGELSLRSSAEQGTIFTARLPR